MNNRQSILLILLIGLFSGFVSGQYLDSFPTKSNALLWKIEGKKVKKDSYIFGTVHLIYKEKFYFPDQLVNLVKNSDQVVLEIGNVNQMEVMQHLLLEKGTIFDFFTPEQADSVIVWAAAKLEMEPEQFKLAFSKMKPFALVQMASQKEIITEILLERGAKPETVKDFIDLTENCEFARYAPFSSVVIKQDYEKAVTVISELEKQI